MPNHLEKPRASVQLADRSEIWFLQLEHRVSDSLARKYLLTTDRLANVRKRWEAFVLEDFLVFVPGDTYRELVGEPETLL